MSKSLQVTLAVLIVLAALGLAVLLTVLGKEPERRTPEQAALLVDVVAPEPSRGRFVIHAQGTVTPRIEAGVVAEVSGRIISVSDPFAAGGMFEAGQVLARIDPSDYETALMAARAELASARATLADERARSQAARDDWERLHGDSREPSELLLRLPQVARAEAAVQAQEAAVARAERDLERTRIRMPFDGMIRERSVDLGQYVGVGTSLGRAFGTEVAEVRLPLAENDLRYLGVRPGDVDTIRGREIVLNGSVGGTRAEWRAALVRTEGVVDENTRLTYLVAEIRDPYARDEASRSPLPMGTFVEARIPGEPADGLVVLPGEAIHDASRIYLANDADELEVREVDIVRSTPRRVYVSADLEASDRVIVTAIPAPVPGLKLNVREARPDREPRLRILPADEELASVEDGEAT